MALSMFTRDEADNSNCCGGGREAWPPLLVVENPAVGDGGDAGLLGSTLLPDGLFIAAYNHMPPYYWQDDMAPGDVLERDDTLPVFGFHSYSSTVVVGMRIYFTAQQH